MQEVEIQSTPFTQGKSFPRSSDVKVGDLGDAELHELWMLFQQNFHGSETRFKDGIRTHYERFSLYRDSGSGELIGFLGFRSKAFQIGNGRKVLSIGMGPSYIRPEYRGKNLIQRSVIRYMLRTFFQNPFRKVFLWTAAATYRPYLLVARNLVDYAPSRKKTQDPDLENLRIQLGQWYYPDEFQLVSHTIRLHSQPLRSEVCRITSDDLRDPDIAHYAHCNPGHARADAIVLVIPASLKNLFHFVKRRLFHG